MQVALFDAYQQPHIVSGMGAVTERERLVRNLVRLKRAHSRDPQSEELVAVRADLESMIGGSVSQALASRVLNVSRQALAKRIEQGDVPTVLTRDGRSEVPVGALVDLAGAIQAVPTGARSQSALGAVIAANRRAADELDDGELLPASFLADGTSHAHRHAELLSLAYHRAVARRLDSQLIADARARLARWRQEQRIHPTYADQWDEVLRLPVAEVARLLVADDARGRDLRQSSPFAGALSEPERRRVAQAVGR
jgi:hypothetical protein